MSFIVQKPSPLVFRGCSLLIQYLFPARQSYFQRAGPAVSENLHADPVAGLVVFQRRIEVGKGV
jgi:hypothetical protein